MNRPCLLTGILLANCLGMATLLVQAQETTAQPPRPAGMKAGVKPADIGRLFTTPEQRERIDNPGSGPATPAATGDGRIDGVVRRSDGRTVVWIDGTPRLENNQALPTLSVVPAKGQK